ncbi:MAG: tripartite tricarboxylate transporter substrate binding protein [Betaproteobacteria bacterium]|nr:tripartite tricarboxylate transporter substrate binding protein [Betaproteobacteria bacterium]
MNVGLIKKWVLVAAALVVAGTAAAQSWPARPVRIIVPWAPGGATDIIARPLAQKLSESFGQQFVVDNRGGANSLIGTDAAAKAPADGHTFLFNTLAAFLFNTLAAFTQNTTYYRKLPYDPDGFTLVAQVGWTPIMMLAHPSLPVKSVRDVIALAKARPGELTYGSFGRGSSSHFAGALLAFETKTNMIHVPYKGGGPVAVANLAGEVPIHYGGVPPTIQFVKAGRLKALAVTAAKRTVFLPDVPTIEEALKVRDYNITVTFGMLVLAGTPKLIADRMHAEIGKIVSSPDFKARLVALGTDETPVMSPAELSAWLKNETARWRRIIELTGIRAD